MYEMFTEFCDIPWYTDNCDTWATDQQNSMMLHGAQTTDQQKSVMLHDA